MAEGHLEVVYVNPAWEWEVALRLGLPGFLTDMTWPGHDEPACSAGFAHDLPRTRYGSPLVEWPILPPDQWFIVV